MPTPLSDRLKEFKEAIYQKGVRFPLLINPVTDQKSVSYTLLIVSFLIVVLGLLLNVTDFIEVDLRNALTLLGITSSLYFGRSLTGTDSNKDTNKRDNA